LSCRCVCIWGIWARGFHHIMKQGNFFWLNSQSRASAHTQLMNLTTISTEMCPNARQKEDRKKNLVFLHFFFQSIECDVKLWNKKMKLFELKKICMLTLSALKSYSREFYSHYVMNSNFIAKIMLWWLGSFFYFIFVI
jgi:hypothetical protein